MATASQRRATGEYGEARAARHLTEDHGMVVLDRNWRCEVGELDLVLRDGQVLVFCEVKTRRDDRFGSPTESVTEQKVARIRHLAARWMQEHDVRAPHVRIDILGVRLDRSGDARFDLAQGVG